MDKGPNTDIWVDRISNFQSGNSDLRGLDISESNERQFWLWGTHPDYYLDEDGCERED